MELCDNLTYVADRDHPRTGPSCRRGQDFVKTWRVQERGRMPLGSGLCPCVCRLLEPDAGQFVALTEVVQPGQEVEVTVQFKAPAAAGEYLSAWTMRNPQGVTFPQIVFVKVIVQ
ncbi:MAG: NBR1-Ig-like domain-containing protein [Ignavibacteriales bacterium]|nr:NBR1-Ig-like domain-containing protein [Ignavibacteriales bacterium]